MSASRFYAALTALLFLAVSAWTGAALFGRLPAPREPEEESPTPGQAGRLRGLLLREECPLAPEEIPPGAEDGKRLSAKETGTASGLFFEVSDGYEFLTPADGEHLRPEALDRLLETAPGRAGAAKLVTGRAVFFAAFFEGDTPPEAGAALRLRFDGSPLPLPARVLSAERDETGRTALLLRLTEGEDFLCRMRFAEAEITKN